MTPTGMSALAILALTYLGVAAGRMAAPAWAVRPGGA